MTAHDVLSHLRHEVGNRWTRTDWPHGVTLERCVLNPPELRRFGDPVKRGESLEFWVVLEENPERRSDTVSSLTSGQRTMGLP